MTRRRFRMWAIATAVVLVLIAFVGGREYLRPKIGVGDKAPDFTTETHTGQTVCLADYLGKQAVVVYFYPADETPGCTTEACAFRDAYADFVDAGAAVIGISGDTLDSHRKFAANRRLPFLLVSDRDGALRSAFGVPKTLGLLPGRVTYVIDRQGIVRHIFSSQLNAGQHVTEALQIVRSLSQSES
ncbi:MAG: peroxiredoxin [Pirellulales bacterium]